MKINFLKSVLVCFFALTLISGCSGVMSKIGLGKCTYKECVKNCKKDKKCKKNCKKKCDKKDKKSKNKKEKK